MDSDEIPNYNLRKYSQQLVERNIDSDKFRQLLRDEGVNPNIEGVRIFININNIIFRLIKLLEPMKLEKKLNSMIYTAP